MKLKPIKVRLFDIESNGLMRHQLAPEQGQAPVSKVHCIVVHDMEAGWYRRFRRNDKEDTIRQGLELMADSDLLIAHNGISYDIPVLAMLYGFSFPEEKVLDTLILSRLIYSDIKDRDVSAMRSGKLPGRLFGSHSLEAWGYRTGTFKDEYEGDPTIADPEERKARKWNEWNPTMEDYCVQDVKATRALFDLLMTNAHYFPEGGEAIFAVQLEHRISWAMTKQERNGFPFSEQGAKDLYIELSGQRQTLLQKLVDTFGSWWAPKGGTQPFLHPKTGKPLPKYPLVKYPKKGELFLKDGKTLSKSPYYEGRPYTPVELVQFNPGSRDHIAKVLMENGWVPTEFTETGKPTIDEETLADAKVDDPKKQAAIDLIAEYMLLVKRIGQIAEGPQAWLRRYEPEGRRIHGSINPNGAITGRATHSYPNIAQVPSAGALWGPQCRALFGAKHWRHVWKEAVQVGTDASGLELRCLGHFMARYDNGEYIDVLLNGDIHWKNVLALGLVPKGTVRDKNDHKHDAFRGNAKTFNNMGVYKLP